MTPMIPTAIPPAELAALLTELEQTPPPSPERILTIADCLAAEPALASHADQLRETAELMRRHATLRGIEDKVRAALFTHHHGGQTHGR